MTLCILDSSLRHVLGGTTSYDGLGFENFNPASSHLLVGDVIYKMPAFDNQKSEILKMYFNVLF